MWIWGFAVIGAIVAIFITIVVIKFYSKYPYQRLRAFRVPSSSMYPTICEHERIIAAMDAYANRDPQRGEIIMHEFKESNSLFVKRVVAIQGDTVKGVGNTIFVNGKKVEWPKVCGEPKLDSQPFAEPIVFDEVKVPPGSFFVLGDNLDNSFDSRIKDFGFVTRDQVRAKPLFLYWSPSFSRIGCDVR